MVNYYEILNVPKTATIDEIKSAYKKLALKYHPDRNPNDINSEIMFKQINEAYQVLSNDSKRYAYDYKQNISDFNIGNNSNYSDLGDMLNSIFYGTQSSYKYSARQTSTQETSRIDVAGDDITVDIELSFEESISGCKKSINVKGSKPNIVCGNCNGIGSKPGSRKIICSTCSGNRKVLDANGKGVHNCSTCSGTGSIPLERCFNCGGNGKVIYNNDIQVLIPAGISAGQQLRIAGQGTPGHPPGNLFVNIKIAPNKTFWRDGLHIHTNKQISLKQAVLGGLTSIKLPFNRQEINIQIPPGTNHGEKIISKGSGVNGPLSKVNGDLVIHIEIEIPKNVSSRARKLIEELDIELIK